MRKRTKGILILFFICSLTVTLTTSATAITAQKFITAYDFSDADIPFISSHFEVIDTYASKEKQVQAIKNANPLIKAIFYKDALTHQQWDAPEDWYVHDAHTGSRLVNKDWGWYLMDIGNPAYRASLAEFIKNNLANNPVFDGVFLDDVWGSVSSDRFYKKGAKEKGVVPPSNISTFHNNIMELLKEIKSSMGSKILIINTGDTNKDYLAVADGQMDEAFCHAKWQKFEKYYSTWQRHLNNMIKASESGKIYLAQSGIAYGATESEIKKTARYCFAMFLLGANNNSYFYFAFQQRYEGVTYFPEWEVDLGSSIENYHARAESPLYEREYSKGLVIINPSAESFQIKLGEKYKNLDGVVTDTITLGTHEGEILLKIPPAYPTVLRDITTP